MAKLKRITVNTVTDLATARPSDGDSVETLGYTSANDGGGGQFYYDSGSSATVDNGFVHDGPSSLGRYIMSDRTVARALQWGWDPTGATADGGIFDAMINSGADVVEFPAGTFAVDTRANIPSGAQITIRGAGIDSTRIDATDAQWATDDDPIRAANYIDSVMISDLTFVGRANATDAIHPMIRIEKSGHTTLRNVGFEDLSTEGFRINQNTGDDATGAAGPVIIEDSRTAATASFVGTSFGRIYGGTSIKMTGCHIQDVARGCDVELEDGDAVEECICSGNTFSGLKVSSHSSAVPVGAVWITVRQKTLG